MTRGDSATKEPKGRAVYGEYIKEQLNAQEARKNSLEQRGLAVITTSGALVTLLFGLTALTCRSEFANASYMLLLLDPRQCHSLHVDCLALWELPSYDGKRSSFSTALPGMDSQPWQLRY